MTLTRNWILNASIVLVTAIGGCSVLEPTTNDLSQAVKSGSVVLTGGQSELISNTGYTSTSVDKSHVIYRSQKGDTVIVIQDPYKVYNYRWRINRKNLFCEQSINQSGAERCWTESDVMLRNRDGTVSKFTDGELVNRYQVEAGNTHNL